MSLDLRKVLELLTDNLSDLVLELPRDEAGHVLDEPDDELDETVHHEGTGQDVRN